MRNQRGEIDQVVVLLLGGMAILFGSLLWAGFDDSTKRAECIKANAHRPAVEVTLLCK